MGPGQSVNWGLLAAGDIANAMATAIRASSRGELQAVAARDRRRAETFASEHQVPTVHASYEALLSDPSVDAVYISTPHSMHAEWAIRAAEHGKHILCEKPLALNHPEAMAIVHAARVNDVFLMEAYMYRVHPQTLRLIELLRDGVIGRVRLVDAIYSFGAEVSELERLFDHQLGGGGILDVGGYCVSLAALVAATVTGQPAIEPSDVQGMAYIDANDRVDHYATATLRFADSIIARLSCGVRLWQESGVRIYGDEGCLHVPAPAWWPLEPGGAPGEIYLLRHGKSVERIEVAAPLAVYQYEVDHVAEHLQARQSPELPWAETLANMRTLDRWREAVGLTYDGELPEGLTQTVAKRPLRRPDGRAEITRAELPCLQREVSRLVFGVPGAATAVRSVVMFDTFFEQGGNAFDTAWQYDDGEAERRLGWWIATRGVRDEVVILDKGAHTPDCHPDALSRQHHESLERLQTDYVDVYMMHRDNVEIPVGEFIEVLNEHRAAGTMRAFGASNWTLERIREANTYARQHGLEGFSVVSNQFSLARMEVPVWPGTLHAFDPEWRTWLEEQQMPLMAWSSQSRGFFVDHDVAFKTDWGDRLPGEVERHWSSAENTARRERARELGREFGVPAITIALAYVLCQPFPTYPVVGPRTVGELGESIAALHVELAPEQVSWLLDGQPRVGLTAA